MSLTQIEHGSRKLLLCKSSRRGRGIRNIAEEFVFLTPRDTPLERNNFRRNVFNKVLDLAEVRHVRLHDLRHTYATLLIENGESLAYIKEQLGHYSIQITVDLYGHLTPGTNKEAVDRLDDQEKVETKTAKVETSGNGRTA